MNAGTELTFDHVMRDERSQTSEATYCMTPLFQISRIQKFIETETRLAVAWGWKLEKFKDLLSGGGYGYVLKLENGGDCTTLQID